MTIPTSLVLVLLLLLVLVKISSARKQIVSVLLHRNNKQGAHHDGHVRRSRNNNDADHLDGLYQGWGIHYVEVFVGM